VTVVQQHQHGRNPRVRLDGGGRHARHRHVRRELHQGMVDQ
jgi:hypothetical protein